VGPEGSLPHSQAPATSPYPEPVHQRISRIARPCEMLRKIVSFYGDELLVTPLTPKVEDHPLSAVRDCLFNISAATLHIWGPFLRLQPEDGPCCGVRQPLTAVLILQFAESLHHVVWFVDASVTEEHAYSLHRQLVRPQYESSLPRNLKSRITVSTSVRSLRMCFPVLSAVVSQGSYWSSGLSVLTILMRNLVVFDQVGLRWEYTLH
jgi:hypothetical protein